MHTFGFTDKTLEAASLKRPVKYQRRPSAVHDRSWLLELETPIARRTGWAFTTKSLSIRSQMSMKTISCIKMTLRMRMAIMSGVKVVPKRRIENMQGSDGRQYVLSVVFLYTCVL